MKLFVRSFKSYRTNKLLVITKLTATVGPRTSYQGPKSSHRCRELYCTLQKQLFSISSNLMELSQRSEAHVLFVSIALKTGPATLL